MITEMDIAFRFVRSLGFDNGHITLFRDELIYWRAWRLSELSVGKYLCEFNMKNK